MIEAIPLSSLFRHDPQGSSFGTPIELKYARDKGGYPRSHACFSFKEAS